MRSLCRRTAALSAFVAALALPVSAAPPGGSRPKPAGGSPAAGLKPHLLRAGDYLPVSALKPGMKGYGLTIFRGTTVEKFDVEVLGVLRRVNNGRDLIFVKLGGPNMRRFSDVIAGMSGSPVYINGKIVGAVAYGAEFTKEPVGYLTPIQDMLDALDPDLPQSSDIPAPTTPSGLRPLLTPVSVSGVPRARFGKWATELEKLGLRASRHPLGAAAAPGGVGPDGRPLRGSALVPGGAVAMSLATGDIDVSAIGTLTFRRGKEIVAFGHPFLGIGPIDAPMFTATIHDVQPSFAESQKIGSAVSLVGAFSQDRPFSIGGRIGAVPRMIPISVKVNDKSFRRSRSFNARLVRHPLLTAQLVPLAAGSAIAELHGQPGDAMATVRYTVETEGAGTITRTDRVFDAFAIDEAATRDLTRLIGLLGANPFQPVGVKRIAMDVTIEPGRRTATVERVFLKKGEFEPGDTVEVGVVLKPYKSEERIIKTLPLTIPKGAPAGSMVLLVQGGSAAGGMGLGSPGGGITLGGGGMLLAPGPSGGVANLKQLLREFQERERGDALVARLLLPTSSVSVGGERLSDLPAHLDAALRAGRSSGLRLERDEVKATVLTDRVLSGVQMLPIRVVRKGAPASPTAPPSPTLDSGSSRTIPASPPGGVGSSPGSPPGTGLSPLGEEDPEAAVGASPQPKSADDAPAPVRALPPLRSTPAAPPKAGEGGGGEETGEQDKPAASAAVASGAAPRAASKVVARLPGVWRQASAADFRGALSRKNVTVTGAGEVRLAPSLAAVAETTEPRFWSLAPDGRGGVYAGGGERGVIHHVSASGQAKEWAKTGEMEVHTLARGADGTVWAGTAPNGRVFSIGEGGKPDLRFDAAEPYVLALALSPDGATLYVGTGGKRARVYAVPAAGKGEAARVWEGDEGSVTALALAPDGKALYAGTSPGGMVVRVPLGEAGAARPAVLFDSPAAAVTGLAVPADGAGVYAATGPARGGLYHVGAGGRVRTLYDRAPGGAFAGLQVEPSGTLYTAAGATLYAVPPTGELTEVRSFEAPSDIQILSVLRDEGGRVWASTGSVGSVYALGAGAGKDSAAGGGELVSSVLDAGAGARWGTIRWSGTAGVSLQTRSGDTSDPDATWSDWSAAYARPVGEKITSPAARYLQYRAVFGAGDAAKADIADAGPVLHSVEAFYLTPNQAPTLAIAAPKPGEVWRGKRTLRWTASDPDKDALRYEVLLSGDGGRTWKRVDPADAPKPSGAAGAEMKSGVAPGTPTQAERKRVLAALEEELSQHPEMSPEMRARILRDAPAQMERALGRAPDAGKPATGATATSSPADAPKATAGAPEPDGGTADTSLPLDTARYPDGAYLLKVVASDRAANPADPQRAERVSAEFRIVNAPPTLTGPGAGRALSAAVGPDRVLKITGVASHGTVAVRAVQCRIGKGDWFAAVADDGLFDSGREAFTLTGAAPLPPGTHEVEVEAQDEAGNSAVRSLTVTVR